MAKSARSSRIKSNKTKLANAVFRPVEEARMARLSEKVLAIANSNKEPLRMPGAMEVETEKGELKTTVISQTTNILTGQLAEPEKIEGTEEKEGAMEVDDEVTAAERGKKKINASKMRRRGRASRHAVVFPGLDKKSGGKRSGGGIRKGVGRRSGK